MGNKITDQPDLGKRTAAQVREDKYKTAKAKIIVQYTEEELWEMKREEVTATLTERQSRWCEIYVRSFNPELACVKAGYSKKSASAVARRLRKQNNVCVYLAWLKLRATDTLDIQVDDILRQYAKIAFADITDYLTLENGVLTLIDTDQIDGQVVKSYKMSKDGIKLELHDKIQALDHLSRFFSEMPKTWQQRIEERRVEIQEQKLELEKESLGKATEEQAEIGTALLNALKGVTNDVWTDDEETE